MDEEDDVLSLSVSSLSDEDSTGDADAAEAEATSTSGNNWAFTPADADLLIRLVKLCQKMGYAGARGTWKEYLKTIEAAPMADPARHSWNVLADFLESLTDDAARQAVQKLVDWERKLQDEDEVAASALELNGMTEPAQGSMWELVQRTRAHDRFAELYKMPAYEEGWQRRHTPPAYDEEPTLLAVDCEMCATDTDDKALLSLCLVDVDGNIVLQSLVKPAEEVRDYRTAVTGHTAADLMTVHYTLEDAQRDVLSALQGQAVLVGHALHHDLHALRLDYQPVIDTSLLLGYQDLPDCTPALSDLVARLLGRQLRRPGEPHDVTADARAAMDLALYEHQKGPTPPLPAPDLQVDEDDVRRLLVHSLAAGMRDVDLVYLFPPGCPPIVEIARESAAARKAVVTFGSKVEAADAFRLLDGSDGADSMGRAQKVVKIPEGKFKGVRVRVRVMHAPGSVKRKDGSLLAAGDSKRLR